MKEKLFAQGHTPFSSAQGLFLKLAYSKDIARTQVLKLLSCLQRALSICRKITWLFRLEIKRNGPFALETFRKKGIPSEVLPFAVSPGMTGKFLFGLLHPGCLFKEQIQLLNQRTLKCNR